MEPTPSQDELETAHCWEAGDRVPGDPATTAFRRLVRWQQARWRDANGHPLGSQPYAPRPGDTWRPVGSRLPVDVAFATGANFVTPAAQAAARDRGAAPEPHQSIDVRRTWADLLSSEALAYNLFGELATDPSRLDTAVHAWWPDAPGTAVDVRFQHSPGWLDPDFIGSLVSFDALVTLEQPDGREGAIAVDMRYHDVLKREQAKPARLARYRRVAERAGIFRAGYVEQIDRTSLVVLWLEHLLALSMVQHPSGRWAWSRYVVVHPAGNAAMAEACRRYRGVLTDDSTFASITLEDLLDADVLPPATARAVRARYPSMR